jgi:hypothetical protein
MLIPALNLIPDYSALRGTVDIPDGDKRKRNKVTFFALGRFARWHIFKPKIQIWANFAGPYNGRC